MSEFEKTLKAEIEKEEEKRDVILENWKSASEIAHLVVPDESIKMILEYREIEATLNTLRYALAVYKRSI